MKSGICYPPDQIADGFDNQASALELSFVHIARYLEAADIVLDELLRDEPPAELKTWTVQPNDLLQIKKGVEVGDARGVLRQTNSAQTPYYMSRVVPHVDGIYRFQIEAFGFHWNHGDVEPAREEQVLSIKSVSRVLHSQSIDVDPDQHEPMEFEAFVRADEKIILYFSTLTTANRPRKIPLETVDAPGVAIGELFVSGPLPSANFKDQNAFQILESEKLTERRINELLTSFMQRVCRHPFEPPIVQRHAEIVQQEFANGATPREAIRAGYKSVLCSPSFLFFQESLGKLSGDALAARLSYFLWKSPPDAELMIAGQKMAVFPRLSRLNVRSTDSWGPESRVGISWTASGVMIPPTKSAAATYKQMFVRGSAAEQSKQVHRLRLGQSILDTVSAEAKSLGRTLGPADRRKVDQYFESVREAERRLEKAEAWVAQPKPSTTSPMPEDINDPRELIPKTTMMYEMAKLALESDSTRIITIHIDENHNPKVTLPGVNDGHHILTHSIWDDEKSKELKTIESEQTRVFGELLGSLRGVSESGQSLLDNTMVLYGSNLGNGASHDTKNMPILLAGGGFRHGQHLAFDKDNNYPLPNLYVSMLQELGIETERFATATGTFRGLETI